MAGFVNAVDMIQSIVRHLNTANVDAMAQKAIAVPVKNKRELDEIASLIHKRALTSPNFVKLYAKLCAELVNSGFNGRVGLGSAFREVLLPKCHDAFVEACKILTATESGELSNRKTTYYVANCEFIGELFNLDVIPKDTAWSYLNELMSENGGHLQMQCQCALLKTAAPKLSKSYSMTRAVGQLLVLRNNAFRNEELPPTLTDLIEDIKYMYLMNWVHESPDELAMRRLYDDDALESFDYNLMSECIYDECWDLLFIYAYNGHSDEGNGFERFLTPVLNSLLRHNRTSFLAAFILAALGVEDDIIRTYAGRLLAALVNAKRLSKFDVVSRFDQILLDEETNAACIYIPDLMNSIRNAFEELLN